MGQEVKIGKVNGFTLVEVLIVVTIIGVLALFAFPAYQNYKIKVQRTDAKGELIFIAQRMQEYRIANGTYAGATVQNLYGKTTIPKDGVAFYNVTFSPSPTLGTGWTLIATPINGTIQADDGMICINDLGQKFWGKSAKACGLSNISSWDGE